MTESDIAKALRRPGALPALVTALGVLVALVVLGFLGATFSSLSVLAENDIDAEFFGQIWAGQLAGALSGPVPIAIGVFLCFWQIAPIAANLRLAHVVTRSLLAAAAGALLLFVLGLAFTLFLWFFGMLGVFDGGGLYDLMPVPASPIGLLFRTLSVLVGVVPLVVLGGVLLWGWLQRHPPKQRVTGTLDEV